MLTDDEFLAAIRECDGLEIHIESDEYKLALELKAEGLVTIGPPRGPDRAFVRVELQEAD